MILSTKKIDGIALGCHVALIRAFDYAKDQYGHFMRTHNQEKGLECTFFLRDCQKEMSFIFWLKPSLEYQLQSLNRAALGVNSKTLYLKELLSNGTRKVVVIVQKEIYYKGGELVADFNGEPISTLIIAPKFLPYKDERIPVLPEKELIVTKYLNDKSELIYEKTSSI
jgi:hypothetical protein